MSNVERYRPIFTYIPDNKFMANIRAGIHVEPTGEISEIEIAGFCGKCDYLMSDNSCKIYDYYEQARIADGEICSLSSVGGAKGQMTEDGFIPSET